MSIIKWGFEDQLAISGSMYDMAFPASRIIDGVRMFPYQEDEHGNRSYLNSESLKTVALESALSVLELCEGECGDSSEWLFEAAETVRRALNGPSEADKITPASWEADHQRRNLEALGLADEFPFDCDSIQHVGEALLAARARIAALEADLARVTDALPKTADGETIVLDLRVWSHVDGDDLYHGVEGRSGWGKFTVRGMCEEMIFVTQDGSDDSDEIPPSDLFRRHPSTGLTPEEAEAQ